MGKNFIGLCCVFVTNSFYLTFPWLINFSNLYTARGELSAVSLLLWIDTAITHLVKWVDKKKNTSFAWYRARRAAKEAKEAPAQPAPAKVKVEVKKFVKIGRPGYKGNLAAWL